MCEKSLYILVLGSNSDVENDNPGVLIREEILFVNILLLFSKLELIKMKKINKENNNINNKKFLLKVVIECSFNLLRHFIFIILIKC